MNMTVKTGFDGFPREAVTWYAELARNNSREWFSQHKEEFETYAMAPARDFVFEMGERLKEIAPKIVADPRVDKSIFRPYRDTRFSKDKAPYKTHLGIFFWAGNLAKMDCPGFYFHLEPPDLLLAAGNHCFSRPLLQQYRDSVVDPKHGPALAKAIASVQKKGPYAIGEKQFKKTPRGYDPSHKNAELLLFGGLTTWVTTPIPAELHSKDIVDYCFARFKDMAPLFFWLLDMIGRV
jgi:uncharacterized protein (TIGR02453 family)